MSQATPLVSIGIPTYNRASLIGRAIESALQQDYPHIEVIISDNASTDATPDICEGFAQRNERVRYIRQPRNLGATRNFDAVLQQATGQYFMWLGDDDWLDRNYVSLALARLAMEADVALVSGTPVYYRGGVRQGEGKVFSLLQPSAFLRVLSYYWQVGDNGLFYGLMRRPDIQQSKLPNFMGGDWVFISNAAARGRIVMLAETAVHRELGGATASYVSIARMLGVHSLQAMFPHLSIAAYAFADIAFRSTTYRRHSWLTRQSWATCAFSCIVLKAFIEQARRWTLRARNGLRRAFATAIAPR